VSGLPPSASIANPMGGSKLHAPSAERNAGPIVALLQEVAPAKGRALEIASGTGQHVLAMARALRDIHWHPTEVAPDRIASINAYAFEAALPNLHPAQHLDATAAGWAAAHTPYDLVYFGNLLHLIPTLAAQTVLTEAAKALTPQGMLILYGPFRRAGTLTSEGDMKFDAQLRAADPAIGYKDDTWITQVLTSAGLSLRLHDMPANNLAFIATRSLP
jgi:predicted O-methyltransferase YrrM